MMVETPHKPVSACRFGDLLVLPPGAQLPKRCPFCNAQGNEPPVKMTISNDTPGKRLPMAAGGALGGAIGGAIAGAAVHGATGGIRFWKIEVFFCCAHQNARKRFIIITLCLVGATIGATVLVGLLASVSMAMLVACLGLVGIAVYAAIAQPRFVYKQNDGPTLFVKGPCASFLSTLPQYMAK